MNKFLQTTLLAVAILLASVFSVLAKKTGDPVGKKATEPTELALNPPSYLSGYNLSSLEARLFDELEDGGFRYDMKYSKSSTDFILIDTKNYASISAIFKGANIDQLKAYFTAIPSMDKLKIIQANRSSFGANTALNTLKKNLQKVYIDNFEDFFQIFWTNSNLRTRLFPNISLESAAKIKFKADINIQISDTNSNAYFDFVNLHDL